MPHIEADWIKELTATAGAGTLTLSGADGLDSDTFDSAMNTGDTCSYVIRSATGTERETGIGTFTAPNLLARTTVKSSTNAGALVNFGAGVKTVFIGPISKTKIPYNPVTNSLVTPLSNTLSAVPVGSGAGNALTISAGSGVGTGSGANLVLNPGEFAGSGTTRGGVLIDGLTVGKGKGSGTENTVAGNGALGAVTTGDYNTAIGRLALRDTSTGSENVAAGYAALAFNSTGSQNVAVGLSALNDNTTGFYNTAVGRYAYFSNGIGTNNVGIGYSAGVFPNGNISTGSGNTFVGAQSGMEASVVNPSNAIVIGYLARGKGSNTTVIGTTSTTATWLYGTVTSNALSAMPVASGLTASVTSASGTVTGPNATITYTAAAGHSFTVGRTVTVTGLTTVTGNNLNCAGRTILSVTSTTFTIADIVGSGSASTATSSVANNATAGGNSFTNTSSNAVTAGPGGNCHFKAGDGVGVGKGGDIEFDLGIQGSSGGDGAVNFVHPNGYTVMKYTTAKQFNSFTDGVAYGWRENNTGLRANNTGNRYLTLSIENYNVFSISGSTLAATLSSGLIFTNTALAAGGSEVATGHFSFFPGNGLGVMKALNGPYSATNGGSFAFPSSTTNIAANTDNLVLTGSAFQRLNCTAVSNLTGIAPPSGGTHDDGRMIRVYNVGTANLTLVHNSGLSTSLNSMCNSTGAAIILGPNDYAELIYDIYDNGRVLPVVTPAPGWRVS